MASMVPIRHLPPRVNGELKTRCVATKYSCCMLTCLACGSHTRQHIHYKPTHLHPVRVRRVRCHMSQKVVLRLPALSQSAVPDSYPATAAHCVCWPTTAAAAKRTLASHHTAGCYHLVMKNACSTVAGLWSRRTQLTHRSVVRLSGPTTVYRVAIFHLHRVALDRLLLLT